MNISTYKKKYEWKLKGQRKRTLKSLTMKEMQIHKQENTY